jgi:hypothetical protein
VNIKSRILCYWRVRTIMVGLLIGLVISATTAEAQLPDRQLYRLYCPAVETHFYTISTQEALVAEQQFGFLYESVAASVWSGGGNGRQPIYRLFHPVNGDHYYTVSAGDRDYAIYHYGYTYETTEGYAYPYQVFGTYPVYQCYRGFAPPSSFLWWSSDGHNADHFYTMSFAEVNYAGKLGYHYDGIAFYAYPGQ